MKTWLMISGQASPDVWRMMVLRGILACLLGSLMIFHPERTIMVLLQILGGFWIIEGILLIIAAFYGHIYEIHRGALFGRGALSLLAGVLIFSHPLVSAVITVSLLTSVLGILAIIFGLMELITGFGIRETFSSKWSLILGGILACIAGVFLLIHPFVSAAMVLSIIGCLTLIAGLLRIVLAVRLRHMQASRQRPV
jgi:uncharacterized membrane protein HdeD (DUF308 family)